MGRKLMKRGDFLFGFAGIIALCCLEIFQAGKAQIVPDATLPINSTVTTSGNTHSIAGGTRSRNNLFHSFQDFSVPTGNTAYFNNPIEVDNILTRVTGGNISHIDGILKANGATNLFLLNPNGIIFGPNARLNIGGSFLASTASAIQFADGTEFSAIAPHETSPLLRVNVPIGLQFGPYPGSIVNQSRAIDRSHQVVGLQVQPNKSLALIGGEVRLEGGYLTAPQGRIEIGSIADRNLVSLQPTTTGFSLGYGGIQSFQNILLTQQATLDTSGMGGGEIQVIGGQVTLTESSKIVANTLGDRKGGEINIQARQLSLQNGAFVSSSTLGKGQGGDLKVKSESIELVGTYDVWDILMQIIDNDFNAEDLRDGLFATSFSQGNGGNIIVETNNLVLKNGALISTSTFGNGQGGHLTVHAPNGWVKIINSALLTGTAGSQAAGDLTVTAEKLSIQDRGGIATTTLNDGQGGNLAINTSEIIEVIGAENATQIPNSRLLNPLQGVTFLYTTSLGSGVSGKLTINTKQLLLKGVFTIITGGQNSQSVSGDLIVNASDLVELHPTPQAADFGAGLSATTVGIARGGDLTIKTRKLRVYNGAQIQTVTFGPGGAGNLTVDASESIELIGQSADAISSGLFVSAINPDNVSSNTFSRLGNAGNLIVKTGSLILRDGASISASNFGFGSAGNIELNASSIQLDNSGSIRAIVTAGERGNIVLRSQSLQMRRGSQITTNALRSSTGGNITIDTGILAALENSDISANSQQARGGRVIINAQSVLGIEGRSQETSNSDITATGGTPDLTGTVEIQAPNLNPTSSLLVLPKTPVDVASLIDSRCSIQNPQTSRFINVGHGGQPPSPSEPLNSSVGWVDDRPIPPGNMGNSSHLEDESPTPSDRLVEAQGWRRNASGQLELVADALVITPYRFGLVLPPCEGHRLN